MAAVGSNTTSSINALKGGSAGTIAVAAACIIAWGCAALITLLAGTREGSCLSELPIHSSKKTTTSQSGLSNGSANGISSTERLAVGIHVVARCSMITAEKSGDGSGQGVGPQIRDWVSIHVQLNQAGAVNEVIFVQTPELIVCQRKPLEAWIGTSKGGVGQSG